MKIFDWVQKKLHQNVIKDGLPGNVKKTDSVEIYNNTQALLEEVAFVDVLESWRDRILTIGTFGFDPLKSSDEQKEIFFSEQEEAVRDEENKKEEGEVEDDAKDGDDDVIMQSEKCFVDEEELNPLMLTKFDIVDTDMIMTVDSDDEITPTVDSTEIDQGKKTRTTLAELFLADSETAFKNAKSFEIEVKYGKNQFDTVKNQLFFAKKLIPGVKDHKSRPIKKLHQMMKRMLKRKIHPDLDGDKIYKLDGQNKPIKKCEAGESVALLHIPDPLV